MRAWRPWRLGDPEWRWMLVRSRLHRVIGLHWYRVNGAVPGLMCYFCGAWRPK